MIKHRNDNIQYETGDSRSSLMEYQNGDRDLKKVGVIDSQMFKQKTHMVHSEANFIKISDVFQSKVSQESDTTIRNHNSQMAKVKAWKLEKQKNKPLVSSKVFQYEIPVIIERVGEEEGSAIKPLPQQKPQICFSLIHDENRLNTIHSAQPTKKSTTGTLVSEKLSHYLETGRSSQIQQSDYLANPLREIKSDHNIIEGQFSNKYDFGQQNVKQNNRQLSVLNLDKMKSQDSQFQKKNKADMPLPSYDISATRGLVFKTPRYNTNTLEFLRHQAHKHESARKHKKQVQKINVEFQEYKEPIEDLSEQQFHPWSVVKPLSRPKAVTPLQDDKHHRFNDQDLAQYSDYQLKKKSDDKYLKLSKTAVEPIELKFSDQKFMNSSLKKENLSTVNQNTNFKTEVSEEDNWTYNTKPVKGIKQFSYETKSLKKKEFLPEIAATTPVVITVENTIRNSFKLDINISPAEKKSQLQNSTETVKSQDVLEDYLNLMLDNLDISLGKIIKCKTQIDLCNIFFLN